MKFICRLSTPAYSQPDSQGTHWQLGFVFTFFSSCAGDLHIYLLFSQNNVVLSCFSLYVSLKMREIKAFFRQGFYTSPVWIGVLEALGVAIKTLPSIKRGFTLRDHKYLVSGMLLVATY